MSWSSMLLLTCITLHVVTVNCFPSPVQPQNEIQKVDPLTDPLLLRVQTSLDVLVFENFEQVQFPLPPIQFQRANMQGFNCDPEKYDLCDDLQVIHNQLRDVDLCQFELELEMSHMELGDAAESSSPSSGLLCSRNNWDFGYKKLRKAIRALRSISEQYLSEFHIQGNMVAESIPQKSNPRPVVGQLLNCMEAQLAFFKNFLKHTQTVEVCKGGYLSPEVMSPESLESALVQLNLRLYASNKTTLIPTSPSSLYYLLPLLMCTSVEGGESTFTLNVPVKTTGTYYEFGVIEPLQFDVEPVGLCQVDVSKRTAIIERVSKRVYFMEDEIRDDCLKTGLCQVDLTTPFSWTTKVASCISEIMQPGPLFQTTSPLDSSCSFTCSKEDPKLIFIDSGILFITGKKVDYTFDKGVSRKVKDTQFKAISPDTKGILNFQGKFVTELNQETGTVTYVTQRNFSTFKDGKWTSLGKIEGPFVFQLVLDLLAGNGKPGVGPSPQDAEELPEPLPVVSDNQLDDMEVDVSTPILE